MEREERYHGLGSHSSYLVGGMRTTGSPPVAPGEPGEVFISPASQRGGGIRIIWEDLGERYSWHVSATTGANLQLPLFSRHPYGAPGPYGYRLIQNGI